MFHKILVCSDGSPRALDAARTGANLAQRLGLPLALLNVFTPRFMAGVSLSGMGDKPAERLHDAAVRAVAAPVFEALGAIPQYLQGRGHPVATIIEVAQREQCDLIVLGARGQSGLETFLLGSVSEGVLRHASCSVLIVPNSPEAGKKRDFKHLLLASDGSASARKATEIAVELARAFRASLTVLNVYEGPGPLVEIADAFTEIYPQEQEQQTLHIIKKSMEDAAATAGIACALREEKGHAAETILRVATEEKPDMILVGHRGLGGFQALLLGSVSSRVAQRSQCPVLVTR